MGMVNKILDAVLGRKDETSGRDSHYFIYPRDKEGKVTGQTICVMLHDGKIFHGMSTCSKEDQYCKKTGRELARDRVLARIQRYEILKGS